MSSTALAPAPASSGLTPLQQAIARRNVDAAQWATLTSSL